MKHPKIYKKIVGFIEDLDFDIKESADRIDSFVGATFVRDRSLKLGDKKLRYGEVEFHKGDRVLQEP